MEAQISVEFEETTSRQSLNSGETINTLWGKVKRWLSDLKAVAFSGSYIDLSDRPTTATTDTDGLMSAEDKTKLDNADNTYALKSKYGNTTINVGRKEGTAVGSHSTAEGLDTIASGYYSHAEGQETTANGNNSCHSEGQRTTASGIGSHAEGVSTNKVTDLITDFSWQSTTNDEIINAWNTQQFSIAHGDASHVEGHNNLSLGHASHSEGRNTVAVGNQSHTSGYYTKALHDNEFACGTYNKSKDDTLFSVGDGTADDVRHNAFEITTTGGKLHDKDIATTDLIPTSLPANGGNADRISNVTIDDIFHSVGLNAISDIDNTDGNWSLSAITTTGEISGTFPPNRPVWAIINQCQTSIGKDFKIQTCQSIEGDVRLWLRSKWNQSEVWGNWVDVYSSSNKPYVTGSATIPADSDTCTTYHGFMPSAAIWWCDDICGAAVSFNENQITVGSTSSTYRTINYLIFK